MLVPAKAFVIGKAADTDNSRYALASVKLDRKDGKCVAVATNGRMLAMAEWVEPDATEFPHEAGQGDVSRLVPIKNWDDLGKQVAKNKRSKPILQNVAICDTEDHSVNMTTVVIDSDLNQSVKQVGCVEGRFPKYEDVIPDYTILHPSKAHAGHAIEITLNADYLAEMTKMAVSDEDGTRQIKLTIPLDSSGPVLAESQTPDIKISCVLMPMYGGPGPGKDEIEVQPEPVEQAAPVEVPPAAPQEPAGETIAETVKFDDDVIAMLKEASYEELQDVAAATGLTMDQLLAMC